MLPTYKKSSLYPLLREIYNFMHSEYIDNNGITETSTDIDLKKFFRLKEKPDEKKGADGQTKFVLEETAALQRILSINELNIEDKLFLNRIAFLAFKRKGAKTTFDYYYSLCKTLQVGKRGLDFICKRQPNNYSLTGRHAGTEVHLAT